MKQRFITPEALDGLAVFVAVAEAKNFRVAGERLRVAASAVSQALQKLETRIGVPLVLRTTRSVSRSEAGERLHGARAARRRQRREGGLRPDGRGGAGADPGAA